MNSIVSLKVFVSARLILYSNHVRFLTRENRSKFQSLVIFAKITCDTNISGHAHTSSMYNT